VRVVLIVCQTHDPIRALAEDDVMVDNEPIDLYLVCAPSDLVGEGVDVVLIVWTFHDSFNIVYLNY
jgi:hypothetical protein